MAERQIEWFYGSLLLSEVEMYRRVAQARFGTSKHEVLNRVTVAAEAFSHLA
jgi:hypothetical protein